MKVSLVMGVYNAEEYLRETLDSILAQTYSDLEIIIVNDGSTDTTLKIINEIKDNRVHIINLDRNQGVANALNIAIAQSKGEWLAIHDSDDISLPNRIEDQVAFVQANPFVAAVGSFVECIAGKNLSNSRLAEMKNLERYKNSIITWEQIKVELYKGCPITHGSLLISKEAFYQAGKYDCRYKIASDYDLFMRLVAVGIIQNIPKVLYKYRVSLNSLSNSDVLETSKEFLLTSTKYIRTNCFKDKKEKPSVIVCGTEEGCKTFQELMLIEGNLEVKRTMSHYDNKAVRKVLQEYMKGNIDAFIILTHAPEGQKLEKVLIKNGLTVSKNFFTLWSAI